MELGEEGAIQVFKPDAGGNMLLGAVGQLQFEVVQHRLKNRVRLRHSPGRLPVHRRARWITADTPAELREFEGAYPLRLAHRRGQHPGVFVYQPLRRASGAGAFSQNPLSPLA